MRVITQRWRNLSIAKKLYVVIGVMAVLIVMELGTLFFAMNILSAVRAFVGGEGLWSKAQKDAVFSLQRYGLTLNEADYQAFLDHLKVCQGDRIARQELQKPRPNLDVVRQGFLMGRNHPDDIEKMIKLLQNFHRVSYLSQAIRVWGDADDRLIELQSAAKTYRSELRARRPNIRRLQETVIQIQTLNHQLTALEDEFSRVLGEGSRWLEWVVISLLSLAVLTVESIGLSLAFVTSRSISRGLAEISSVAYAIGHGELHRRAKIKSRDEIGFLGDAINTMGDKLQVSYKELEARVAGRTAELARAVRARDEFLSIASHELKTPLTSLGLQTQLRARMLATNDPSHFTLDKLSAMFATDERQVKRLTRLIDDMLDISRLGAKKMQLVTEDLDLSELTDSVCDRFKLNLKAVGCDLTFQRTAEVWVHGDQSRIEQILENLLTNAMKYGAEKPVLVRVWQDNQFAHVSVQDEGMGIAPEDQARIFMQFERAAKGYAITGLGLGLFIAREIASLHGGKLSVMSELEKGSTFTLSLPRKTT